jgi:hypothetical protein
MGQELINVALADPDYPIDAIVAWTKRVAHVASMLADGKYVTLWIISGGPHADARTVEVLRIQFSVEAAIAARAADLIQPSATDEEAVDAWLDFMAGKESPYVIDDGQWIDDLPAASALSCVRLASSSFAAASARRESPDGAELTASLTAFDRGQTEPN